MVLRLQAQPDSSNFLTNTLQMNNTPMDSQALYDDFIIFHIFHHMPWNFERLGTTEPVLVQGRGLGAS